MLLKIIKTSHAAFVATVAIALAMAGCDSGSQEQVILPAAVEKAFAAPQALKVGEGFVNPVGYYEAKPRFSWQLAADSSIKQQTAYQLQVASSLEQLVKDPDLWDSGKVVSSTSAWLRYQGKPLASRQQVFWRVKQWGDEGEVSEWSNIQTLELGLLSNSDWKAKWIGHPDTALDQSPSKQLLATPQYLRTTFEITAEVAKARLYISAKGLFKPYINGSEIAENDVMTPGWTPYAKRIESLTYDVTDILVAGENAIAASIAGGWYAGRIAGQMETDHRLPARLLAQLEITYKDGSTQHITTNENWLASQQGPIRFASIYDGEHYDQNMEIEGWSSAGFQPKTSQWQAAVVENFDPNIAIKPKRHNPIRSIEQLAVADIISTRNGVAVFDFGQNMVGVPSISVPAIAGQQIKIRFAEALNKGEFYTDNYRSADSTNIFLPSKTGVIHYTPIFTYHGYRYVEISGYDAQQTPGKDWVSALVQHSDIELYNNFSSSHGKLNKLSQNIVWGMRSNFFDIPLDCPQRDERLGWTGDAQVFATPSMYMADVYPFWGAWLQSVREEQTEQGMVPLYVPFIEWINWASSGWGDAVTIIPWELYRLTGDKTILADNFSMMQQWLAYHESQSANGFSNMKTFGDWLQPYPLIEGKGGNRGDTDFNLISTAFYALSVQLTLKTAKVLGKNEDIAPLTARHNQLKQVFRERFFDDNLVPLNGNPTQTTYLLGLAFSLFAEDEIAIAQQKLIALIADAGNHLRTGFLGTPLLASVLQQAGRSDLVYELLLKETYPSWFYSINNDATTTWERWDSYSLENGFNPEGMNSLNHYAYGTISRWFYEGILGITPAKAGFEHILIEPQLPPKHHRSLSEASGFYYTPHGKVAVDWVIEDELFTLNVTVPKNTTADVVLPAIATGSLVVNGKSEDASLRSITAGQYQIKAQLAE